MISAMQLVTLAYEAANKGLLTERELWTIDNEAIDYTVSELIQLEDRLNSLLKVAKGYRL